MIFDELGGYVGADEDIGPGIQPIYICAFDDDKIGYPYEHCRDDVCRVSSLCSHSWSESDYPLTFSVNVIEDDTLLVNADDIDYGNIPPDKIVGVLLERDKPPKIIIKKECDPTLYTSRNEIIVADCDYPDDE